MRAPMVTVLMSVYNGEKFLKEAVESILNQTFDDFEFLIINDGSTDKSVEIIKEFNDERIRLINNETNLKLIASLNKGINLAKGKYIARMDCDDISMPERLENQVKFLEENKEYGLVGTWYEIIDAEGNKNKKVSYPTNNDLIKLFLSLNCPLAHGSIIGRTELFKKNSYGSKTYSAVEDYELWTRISKETKIYNIPKYLFRYRVYGESYSDTKTEKMYNETLQLSKDSYKINKKYYKKLAKEQILKNMYKSEDEEVIKYVNNWILSFAKRFLYVYDFEMALRLFIKSKKENKENKIKIVDNNISIDS